jgi:hypothetical protein
VATWEQRLSVRAYHAESEALAAFGGGRSADQICDALCAYVEQREG